MTDQYRSEVLASITPLFNRVRQDVHWEKSNGKQRMRRSPLTRDMLKHHINGGPAYGACPIKAGESVTMVGLFDLDSHGGETSWDELTLVGERLDTLIRAKGYFPICFRSSGGRGLHIYMVWDAAQDAYSVRTFMRGLLAEAGLTEGTGGVVAGQVEIFPKQDRVPSDGFGNQFILPFAGESLPVNYLVSVDPLPREWAECIEWQGSPAVPFVEPVRSVVGVVEGSGEGIPAWVPDALQAIDADCGYEDWLRVGMALHWASGGSHEGLEMWDEWSSEGGKYAGRADLESKWPTFDRQGGAVVTLGTVRKLAEAAGWVEDISGEFPIALDTGVADTSRRGNKPPFKVHTLPELMARPPVSWLIKGVLPKDKLAVLYAESGVGKTFVVLDMSLAIARGVDWQGRRVKRGGVLYVAAEGGGGLPSRLKAYQQYHDLDLSPFPFGVISNSVSLIDGDALRIVEACASMGAAGHPVTLVVLDTLNRSMGGGDENSSADMGAYLAAAGLIHEQTGATVLVVHHSGKDASKGARGHSSLKAAVEGELEVKRDGDVRILRVSKSRDGRDGDEFAFKLTTVELGLDDDGDPITSCVVTSAHLSDAESRRPKPQGQWQERVFKALDWDSDDRPKTEDEIIDMIGNEGGDRPERWREIVKRAIAGMVRKGVVEKTYGGYTIP